MTDALELARIACDELMADPRPTITETTRDALLDVDDYNDAATILALFVQQLRLKVVSQFIGSDETESGVLVARWNVTIAAGLQHQEHNSGYTFTFPYSAGCVAAMNSTKTARVTIGHFESITRAEFIKSLSNRRLGWHKKALDQFMANSSVKLDDALAAVVNDAMTVEHDPEFSEWCADFGYDDDSIKAKAAYDACCEARRKLRRLVPCDNARTALSHLVHSL